MTEDGWGSNWNVDPLLSKAIVELIDKNYYINLRKEGSNLVDNEGLLYFQCDTCQKLFDPATKSFKKLHDYAHKQGWKVVWNVSGLGYKIYCGECKG